MVSQKSKCQKNFHEEGSFDICPRQSETRKPRGLHIGI